MGICSSKSALQATKSPEDTQTPTEDNIVQPEANLKPSFEDYQASVDNITDEISDEMREVYHLKRDGRRKLVFPKDEYAKSQNYNIVLVG